MSLQSKKNLVRIQTNKKSVKSSFPRRLKANKSRSKTQLKSKRFLRATSQRPTASKKKSFNQLGSGGITLDKVMTINNEDGSKIILSYSDDNIQNLKYKDEKVLQVLGCSSILTSDLKDGLEENFLFMPVKHDYYTLIYLIDDRYCYNFYTNEINQIDRESVNCYRPTNILKDLIIKIIRFIIY